MNVSYCPIRSNFDWSNINTIPMDKIVFNKDDLRYQPTAEDLREEEEARRKEYEERVAAEKAVAEAAKSEGEGMLHEQRVLTAKQTLENDNATNPDGGDDPAKITENTAPTTDSEPPNDDTQSSSDEPAEVDETTKARIPSATRAVGDGRALIPLNNKRAREK